MKRFTVTYVINCESTEKLHEVMQQVTDRLRPDSLHTDVGTANERVYVQDLRIGDYFASVQVTDSGPTSFRLAFSPHPDADRYWKDMVVNILTSIRDTGASVIPQR